MQSYSLENNDSAGIGKLKQWQKKQAVHSDEGKSLHFLSYSLNDESLINEIVQFMPQLDFMSFSSCKIPSKSLTHIARALASSRSLRILKFWDCDIDNMKLAILGEGIQAAPHLETLRIQRTKVSDLYGISRCSYIITLDASQNAITTLESLQQSALSHSLQDLDLSSNRISKLKDLPRLSSLRVLNLEQNSLQDIPDTFKRSLPRIQKLDLVGNPIVSDLSNLTKLTTLQSLSLPSNCSNEKTVALFGLPRLKELYVGTQAIELPEKVGGTLDSLSSFLLSIICCESYGRSERRSSKNQ
mmetsp:Transcript_32833/g.46640  ORF Transcript_32833/g.46640 Transcript_32833/m.46640 type:complete len:300 (+) Transcript_32833:87-986(+)